MSRTDIHKPIWAMWLDPTMRHHFREVHDHGAGVCDLDTFLGAFRKGEWVRTRCRVQWSSHQRICACELCSGRDERRMERRRARRGVRRALKSGGMRGDPSRLEAWDTHRYG